MAKIKLGFGDFVASVSNPNKEFVTGLHQEFTAQGYKMEVKEAKSRYVVSYLLNKKTVANYVFRKAGLIIRIYGNHIKEYMDNYLKLRTWILAMHLENSIPGSYSVVNVQ